MDGSDDILLTLLLFAGLFLNWIKAAVSTAIAVFIRHRAASVIVVAVAGTIEGLVGSRLELLDLYLTRDGWVSIDALTLITVALSAVASFAWWCIARALYTLVRRVLRPAVAH